MSAAKRRAVTARGWHASPFGMDTPTTCVTKPLPNTVKQHYLVRSPNRGLVLLDDPNAALLDSWDRRERIKTYLDARETDAQNHDAHPCGVNCAGYAASSSTRSMAASLSNDGTRPPAGGCCSQMRNSTLPAGPRAGERVRPAT